MTQHQAKERRGNPNRSGSGSGSSGPPWYERPEGHLKSILDGMDPSAAVKNAEDLARACSGISSSQIRNIYGTVKKIEMDPNEETRTERLVFLKPKLAYAVARSKDKKGNMNTLKDVLMKAIDLVSEKPERFQRFTGFFEAVLAYHKFHSKEKDN